jgi:hypothetical protein
MFSLDQSAATITSVTNISEKHGNARVPAVSIGISVTGASVMTDEQRDIAAFKWHAKQEDAGLTVSGRDRLIFMDGFNAAKALAASMGGEPT